jgi:hypothetical protein
LKRQKVSVKRRTSSDGRAELDGLKAKLARSKAKEVLLGDWLLEMAALGEEYGIDAERALNAASKRFAHK